MELLTKYFSDFTPKQVEQFTALGPLYKEWNEKINVISRKNIDNLYEQHILHSLSIAAVFEFRPGMTILDLGTGGGFPGVPLAIFFPEIKFILVDSIAKKLKVINEVAAATGITNITTRHSRVEDLKDVKVDMVVSRAVAPLKDLWQWSKPLLRRSTVSDPDVPGPGLICLKGGDLAEEIHASNTRPRVINIDGLFEEEFFHEKYLLYVPKN
ncbi:16S rRNA (guanine(527)-N(7))-methyltransferase RsmG [Nostoc ellipsosporum NOK]|nr:16S rRNA (guanine(527)-N(7))-methyltransferase RsmG [Nostoc ellipsosporum NOK]